MSRHTSPLRRIVRVLLLEVFGSGVEAVGVHRLASG